MAKMYARDSAESSVDEKDSLHKVGELSVEISAHNPSTFNEFHARVSADKSVDETNGLQKFV